MSAEINSILVRGISVVAYNGVYGWCPLGLRLSDHPRLSAVLTVPAASVEPVPETSIPETEGPDERVCSQKPWTPGC